MGDVALPADLPPARIVFFPGSTIGNLDDAAMAGLLARMKGHAGGQGRAIIGIDLVKPLDRLLPAYDDARGVTAAFNRNLLIRANRELGADFDLEAFAHEARWNAAASAVEMHLVSTRAQQVSLGGRVFTFALGETIHTESSRKFDLAGFRAFVGRNGWAIREVWTDPACAFAVVGLEPEAG
jgi:uncharacterized SAM-dependent methyltransferase